MEARIVIFFSIIVLISFLREQNVKKCKDPTRSTYIISFIHHIIAIYMMIGTLCFGNPVLHLFVLLLLLTIWKTSHHTFGVDDACPVTVVYNNMCGFPVTDGFNDIIRIVTLKFTNMRVTACIILLYDLYIIRTTT